MKKYYAAVIAMACCLMSGCSDDSSGSQPQPTEPKDGCPGVDLQTDKNNCGACGKRCLNDLICQEGWCVDPTTNCPGVNLQISNDNCGACGHVCGGDEQCVEGECKKKCGDNINMLEDSKNCGACGYSCPVNKRCEQGECVSNEVCTTENMKTDNANCGYCGHKCGENALCTNGNCVCESGYSDCNGDGICETEGECECQIGDEEECYTGPEGTAGVGACKKGVYKCVAMPGTGEPMWDYNTCVGQVVPKYEYTCSKDNMNLDEDCNGIPDAGQDEDGDGYPVCDKDGNPVDCCDNEHMCRTLRPDLIHPGKSGDCRGNNLDDDCDGVKDEDEFECDDAGNPEGPGACGPFTDPEDCKCEPIKERKCSLTTDYDFSALTEKAESEKAALALLKAMDLCIDLVTEESGEVGLIEYSLMQVSGRKVVDSKVTDEVDTQEVFKGQVNVLSGMYGANSSKIEPRVGGTFAVLSSGLAIDANSGVTNDKVWYEKNNPREYIIPEPYASAHLRTNADGSVKVDANGHKEVKLQSHLACGTNSKVYDTVHLHLKMRAPKLANSIQFDFRFFTQEYPSYICTAYNDFFVALLTDKDGHPINGGDGNISFDENNNPISVNNALFTACAPYKCSSAGYCKPNATCNKTTNECGNCRKEELNELYAYSKTPYIGNGTYMTEWQDMRDSLTGEDGVEIKGGGTAWLTTKAPITPGEVFNLDIYLWDTGDARFDSSLILDNFQWNCDDKLSRAGTDYARPLDEDGNPVY